jgi:peptidoglycan glycosyltransferase
VTGSRALAFDEAVEVSCNIYFALAGLRTGGQALVDGAAGFGFGAPIPFDLPTAPSQVTGGGGSFGGGFSDDVELANAAYGQGETLVTPLQMALVAAAVANHGIEMKPYLVQSASGRAGTTTFGPAVWQEAMSPGVAAEIAAAMRQAVNGDLGRQFTAGARVTGLTVAGKSGTAEVDPGSRPHSWFIGFAPYDDPQVAIAVIVEHGGFDVRASPLAGALFRAWRTWANR